MTTSQIIQLARIKLLELTNEVVSDETLLTYANLVDMDMVKRTFTTDKVRTRVLSLVDGEVDLPSVYGTMYGSARDMNGNKFEEVSIEDFHNKVLSRMFTIENGKIKVYPSNTSNIEIKYYPTYSKLTAASEPSVNEYFHECYIYGIISRAFEDLQDEELSAYYNAKYESMVAQRGSIQSNYEEDNVRGSQFFNHQRLV